MSTYRGQTITVATDEGMHVLDGEGGARVDDRGGWAIVGKREIWQSGDGRRWSKAAAMTRGAGTCLAATPAGLLVGTAGAHLLRLDGHRLASIPAFDEVEGRADWHTPWGAPADVRSISASPGGPVYVNVHVGGVVRSTDGGVTWRPTLDIDHDVHEVLAPAGRPRLVLVAAYDGFGRSDDGGDTWRWENAGLHAHYCRAVAVAGDTVYLSASTGHHGRRAALYRRPLDGAAPFERCRDGLPEWFADNLDTGCLAARGRTVAIGTEDGIVFVSGDAGARWEVAAKGLAPVRAVDLG